MRRSLTLAAVLLFATQAIAQDKPLDGDTKKLQGKWTTKGPDGSPLTIQFDKDKFAITLVSINGEERTIAGDFAIDEKAEPRAMDWRNVKIKAQEMPDLTAIYAFKDDDTLKIAGVGGTKRPTEFLEKGDKLPPGIRANTMVLSRVKDEPKK